MNVIRILPENVASQIAAGEVIDRPASVVRELVDNSIDAGADRITVRVENGGSGLIRVSDNGCGMTRDDLLLCIERHATSKIGDAADLYSIKTLGFRGEAIPSIASVSRLKISSRPKDRMEGYRLRISGGRLDAVEEAGIPAGTVVEMEDLFYNLPARKKFLRAPKTEMDHILDTLARVVLPFPHIGFRLEEAGRTVLNFPAARDMRSRLFALMGRKTAEAMTEAEFRGDTFSLNGYLAPPDINRGRADHLFIYVNGRNVRDRLLTRAVMDGYSGRIMKGRYPQAVILIRMSPSLVDVNVHPAKQEVRFHDSRIVYNVVVKTINSALARFTPAFLTGGNRDKEKTVSPGLQEGFSFLSEPASVYSRSETTIRPSFPASHDPAPATGAAPEPGFIPSDTAEVIGNLGNTYILCEAKDGLILVDQHAAHERIVYEAIKKGIQAARLPVQNLLVPLELEFSVKETGIAIDRQAQLLKMGFELDHFGGNAFLLRSHPAMLQDVKWDEFFPELLAELAQGKPEEEAALDRVLTVMACHGAIRAGYVMSMDEMVRLIRQLKDVDIPTNCPHGRPVFRHFSYYELEKMFKRVI